MVNSGGNDLLRKITPWMLLPFILVGIAAGWTFFAFYFLRFKMVTCVIISLPLIGIAFIAFYDKMLPLIILAVLVPFNVPGLGAMGINITEIIVPLLLLVYVLQRMIHKSDYNRVRFYNLPIVFLVIFIIGFISYLLSGQLLPGNVFGFRGIGSFRSYLQFFISMFTYIMILSLMKEEKHVSQVPKILFWVSLISLMYFAGLIILFRQNTFLLPKHNWTLEYFSGGRLPVRSIAMANMALLLYLLTLSGVYPKQTKFRLPLFFFGGGCMLIAGGRTILIGALLATMLFLYYKKYYMLVTISGLIVAVIVGAFVIFPQVVEALPEGMQRVLDYRVGIKTRASRSIEGRMGLWRDAVDEIIDKPIKGSGFKGIDLDLVGIGGMKGQELWQEMGVASGSTHNGYLSWATVFGIPGLLLFLIWFFNHYGHSLKIFRHHYDPELKLITLFLLIMLIARAIILFAGGGPKDAPFFLYLGFAQATWIYVLARRKRERIAERIAEEEAEAVLPTLQRGSIFSSAMKRR